MFYAKRVFFINSLQNLKAKIVKFSAATLVKGLF